MNDKTKEKDLVDELRSFFDGRRRFVMDSPPTDISNTALTVLRALFALEFAHRMASEYYLARDAASPDVRFDIEASNAGVQALGSLIEALRNGGRIPSFSTGRARGHMPAGACVTDRRTISLSSKRWVLFGAWCSKGVRRTEPTSSLRQLLRILVSEVFANGRP